MDDVENENKAVLHGESNNPLAGFGSSKNKLVFACAILASIPSLIFGYDAGVMSGSLTFIQEDLHLSDTQYIYSFIIMIPIIHLFGSIAAGRTSDWIGRRSTIFFACITFFIGSLMVGLTSTYTSFMVSQIVTSISISYSLVIGPLYISEISPASSGGFFTCFPEIFINFGILLGYISYHIFSKLQVQEHISWRLMLVLETIPSAFLAFGVILIMPESPHWLVMQGRVGESKRVLTKITHTAEEAELRLDQIKVAAGIPDNCTDDDVVTAPKHVGFITKWKELLIRPSPDVKRALISAVGLYIFQEATGINAVVLYSKIIFKMDRIKLDTFGAMMTVGSIKTCWTLVAAFLLDKVGLRPMLLTSVGGMILCLAGLGFGLTIIKHSEDKLLWAIDLCVVMVVLCVVFYSIGLGPIMWVYGSEIFPLRFRSEGVSLGVGVNHVTRSVTSFMFIELHGAINVGGCFFLFSGLATVAWVFFYMLLPETQGKSLKEMGTLFGKFKSWSLVKKRQIEKREKVGVTRARVDTGARST